MKLILLAAAAAISVPAIAQTTQATPDQQTPTSPATSPTPDPSTNGAMQPGMNQSATGQTAPTDPSAAQQPMAQPMQQPMSTGSTAGAQPTDPSATGAAPTATAAQTDPAPAPKSSYPICKKGQYDECMEPGGSGHAKRRHKA